MANMFVVEQMSDRLDYLFCTEEIKLTRSRSAGANQAAGRLPGLHPPPHFSSRLESPVNLLFMLFDRLTQGGV